MLTASDQEQSSHNMATASLAALNLNEDTFSSAFVRTDADHKERSRKSPIYPRQSPSSFYSSPHLSRYALPSFPQTIAAEDEDSERSSHELTKSSPHLNSPNTSLLLTRPEGDQVELVSKSDDRERMLIMIHNLMQQIESNRTDVEREINNSFDQLEIRLNARRKQLLEEVRTTAEKKTCLLLKAKERCARSKRSLSRRSSYSDTTDVQRDYGRPRQGSVDDHDDILQHNGILEPWRNGDDEPENNESSVTIPHVRSSSQDSGVSDAEVFSELLEEGNLLFRFSESSAEFLSKIGGIEESLSSPQLTSVQGVGKDFGILGESCAFDVITRNKLDERTFSSNDNVVVTVYDEDEQPVPVQVTANDGENRKGSTGSTRRERFSNSKMSTDKLNGALPPYSVSFQPASTGKHTIHITVNGVEITDSPFYCNVHAKRDLTFDVGEKRAVPMLARRESLDDDWVVQKDDKTSLLHSMGTEIPSVIYAATEVEGMCAWKVRVTVACSNIVFSVGVATRSGIPDIDDAFVVDFDLSDSMQSPTKPPEKKMQRKLSTFSRTSFTFTAFLNSRDQELIVTEDASGSSKRLSLKSVPYKLYPVCSMLHRHKCGKLVCPRPVIKFT